MKANHYRPDPACGAWQGDELAGGDSRAKLGKSASRLGEIRADASAASFTALLDQAKVAGPHTHNFYDSGEVRIHFVCSAAVLPQDDICASAAVAFIC